MGHHIQGLRGGGVVGGGRGAGVKRFEFNDKGYGKNPCSPCSYIATTTHLS